MYLTLTPSLALPTSNSPTSGRVPCKHLALGATIGMLRAMLLTADYSVYLNGILQLPLHSRLVDLAVRRFHPRTSSHWLIECWVQTPTQVAEVTVHTYSYGSLLFPYIWGQQPCIDKNRVLLTFIFGGSQDHCLNFAKSSTEEYNSALSAIKMTHTHTQKCQARIILPHAAHAWLSRPLILPGLMLQYTTTFHNEGCFWHQRRQLAFNRVPSVCEQAGRQVCCIKRNVLQQCTSEELLSLQCAPLQVLQGSLMVLSLSAIELSSRKQRHACRMDSVSKDVFCTSVSPQISPNILDRIQYGVTMWHCLHV